MCRFFDWMKAPSREDETREKRREALQRDTENLDVVKKRLDGVLAEFDQTIQKMADEHEKKQ